MHVGQNGPLGQSALCHSGGDRAGQICKGSKGRSNTSGEGKDHAQLKWPGEGGIKMGFKRELLTKNCGETEYIVIDLELRQYMYSRSIDLNSLDSASYIDSGPILTWLMTVTSGTMSSQCVRM